MPDHELEEIQEYIEQYNRGKPADGDTYIEFYIKAHAEISAEEAAIRAKSEYIIAEVKRETEAMLGDLNNRRKGLDWNHKEPVLGIVATKLEGKKARHIKTLYGRIGFRKKAATKKLVVHDEAELQRKWPTIFQLVPKLDKPKLKAMLEAGERCTAGAWLDETPAQDNFYVDTGKQLEAKKQAALPEKGTD